MSVETRQVLWLIMPFNNSGNVSRAQHPYLVIDVDDTLKVCSLVQLDSLEGKSHKVLMKSNKLVMHTNPSETVISKASFAQLDNTMQVELFDGLSSFRRTTDKLSGQKYDAVLRAYRQYRDENEIDENKIVYVDKERLIELNS